MNQGCRHHLAGPLTLIVNGPFGRDSNEISLAINFCRGCGRAFTNDPMVFENMATVGKVALSRTLNQLPSGSEAFSHLFQLNEVPLDSSS